MSFYPISHKFAIPKSFQLDEGLPFTNVLSEKDIQKAFDEADCHFAKNENNIFTPAITLWAFLSQMLHSGSARSCNAAVLRIQQFMHFIGKSIPALNSGGYCKARAKIDEAVPYTLLQSVADKAEDNAKDEWKWNGRNNVFLVDGTTFNGPDTAANQAAYPQSSSQAEGCGFPIMQCVMMTSLITAMVRTLAFGPCRGKGTGEGALFRKIAPELPKGSVVVGDRYYCSYFTIAILMQYGIDVVSRLTPTRLDELKKSSTRVRMKNGDWLVTWQRSRRPDWMPVEEYATMPGTLTLRLTEVHVAERGFRVKHFWTVSTLLDEERDSGESLADLYRRRWHVELDLNSIKTMMGLDELRCKTPRMMRLELLVGILAYNLVRLTILNSSSLFGMQPRAISFTASLSMVASGWTSVFGMSSEMFCAFGSYNLRELSKQRVGHRGGRVEPRVVKRRPKHYPRMQQTRAMLKEKIRAEKTECL
jgi:hypothetical protein